MHSSVTTNGNQRCMEDVPLRDIIQQYGSPCYAYSKQAISENFLDYQRALSPRDHLICYAVKSNSNIAVLQTLAKLGAGFDIVSVGELEVLLAGAGDLQKWFILALRNLQMKCVARSKWGFTAFNVESESELKLLNKTAAEPSNWLQFQFASILMWMPRLTPTISTGLKENKFGIDINRAYEVYQQAAEMENISVVGVDCHIGSQLTDITPFIDAMQHLLVLVIA